MNVEEIYCYNCKHYYEGFICGFILTSNEEENMEDIKYKRKDECELDKYLETLL